MSATSSSSSLSTAPPPPDPTTITTSSSTGTTAPPPPVVTSTSLSSSSSSSSSSSLLPGTTTAPVARPTTTAGLSTTSRAGGGVVTQISYSTAFVSSTGDLRPTSSATNTSSSSKGFFSNVGAVAGVFSVVGLIGVAVILVVVTNTIRRRRARKFDKELAEATLEAASAPKPAFLDDDDDDMDPYRNRGGVTIQGYNNIGGYSTDRVGVTFSEASHGTYSQAPMSTAEHGGEAYGMRDLGGRASVKPGEIFDSYGAGAAGVGAAGAAGIGVARARSTMRADGGYAAGLQDGAAPYAAFAAPAPKHDPYAAQQNVQMPLRGGAGGAGGIRDPNADILEAAGIGSTVAGAGVLSRGQSQQNNKAYNSQYQPHPSQAQQPQFGGLHQRSQSQLQQAQELEYGNSDRRKSVASSSDRRKSLASRESHGGQQQQQVYSPTPLSAASNATSNATRYFSPLAESFQSHHPTQNSQGGGHHTQQPENRDSTNEDDMNDAYGGYVADEHQGPIGVALGDGPGAGAGSAVTATRALSGNRQSGLLNPFEGGSSSGHGKHEHDENHSRESRYSDDEEEAPRRVLKIANQ